MNISKNFNRDQFVSIGRNLSPIQDYMLEHLCNEILEPLMDFLECDFKIKNGVRFPTDNNFLRKEGENPSETSDHLFGNVIKIKSQGKRNRWGDYFSHSVGAADVIPSIGAKRAFQKLIPCFDKTNRCINIPNRTIKIGQVILENKNGNYWIHISNPSNLIYCNDFSHRFLYRSPFAISSNNGQNYSEI